MNKKDEQETRECLWQEITKISTEIETMIQEHHDLEKILALSVQRTSLINRFFQNYKAPEDEVKKLLEQNKQIEILIAEQKVVVATKIQNIDLNQKRNMMYQKIEAETSKFDTD